MRKKFLSDFFFIQILNLLIKPVWILVIDRKIQNVLPPTEYGTYFSLTGYSLLFMILLDLGLSNFNNREVAIDRGFYTRSFRSLLGLKLLLTALFFVLGFIGALLIGFSSFELKLFFFLALNQTILSFNNFLRSNISAIHQFKLDGILSVVDRLFVIVFLSMILWTSLLPIDVSLDGFVLTQTAGLTLTLVLAIWANRRYLGAPGEGFDRQQAMTMLRRSLPYASIIALMTLYTRLDSVLVLKMLPDGHLRASDYAMCYRLLDAAAIIGTLLAGQLLPVFASSLTDKKKLADMVKGSALLVILPALAATVLCSLYGDRIMEIMYPGKYTPLVGHVFSILIWCIPGMVLVNVFGTLLTAAGRVTAINRMALLACVVNIFGNLFFIREYGLVAVAWTAVATQVFFGGLCLFNSRLLLRQAV